MQTTVIQAPDDLVLEIDLCVQASPSDSAYRARIELSAIDMVVEVCDNDLGDAVLTAVRQCSERLRERGYAVTAANVLAALDVVEGSDIMWRSG